MPLSIGIVGLPNAGKSTLFQAITKKQVDIASYPFTTIKPNVGVVAVPDERLKKLAEALKPPKTTPAVIEFIDIAGLVRGAHKGEGLGNQFLSHIRECDAILHLIRCFPAESVEHVEGTVDPTRDKNIVETELLLKDLETAKNALEEAKTKAKGNKEAQKSLGVLEKIYATLSAGSPALELQLKEDEQTTLKKLALLTAKPIVYVLNVGRQGEYSFLPPHITLNAEEELEISELSDEERATLNLNSNLDLLIRACYDSLDLITFFTIAGLQELRAWSIKRGMGARDAAGKVHSDFQEKFIRAEVIPWNKLLEYGSWTKAKQEGAIKTVGKDYEVQDGDVIEFKI